MKLIDTIINGLGLVDEEEVYEDELEEKKAKPKEERKSFFHRKEQEKAPAKEEKSKGYFSFGKKKEEDPKQSQEQASAKETAAEETAASKGSFMDKFKKREKSEKTEAPAKKESFFKGKRNVERSINLPIDNKQVNVIIIEPTDFDDSPKIADHLRNGEPVVVNFEGVDVVLTKRMTDFVSGTIYALNGSMKKIGRNILVCAPRNVDIDAGVEYEEKGEQPWKR